MEEINISILVGKTLTRIVRSYGHEREDLTFHTVDGETYRMFHEQDCCEEVVIEDICGNLDDLLRSPILIADERTKKAEEGYDSITWTFYELATVKGSVTIRWHGTSNGYYSEAVSFEKVD